MRIVIPGEPIAKARHRSFLRGKHIRSYNPQAEQVIKFQQQLKNAKCGSVSYCPLIVDLTFQMDAFRGVTKPESNLRLWGYSHPMRKDLDNLEKYVLDCGNGILWSDDRYIVQLSSKKIYSNNPCTIIDVKPITELKMSKDHENVFKTFSPSDLQELEYQMDQISTFNLAMVRLDHQQITGLEMASAADALIQFADRWADKLKKIKSKGLK